MAEAFTEQWIEELRARLARLPPHDHPARLALGQLVTGAPGGDVSYTILVGGGEPAELRRGLDDASVTLVETYETARALASGTPASTLLSEGRLKVRGDSGVLLAAQELLCALAPALSPGTPPGG
ncbi:MAG: hypothetical protein M0Z33_12115 [Actinomycetota bacterium]|nr:hypothetical protein [Actinomycetota bacterium]